MPRRPRVFVDGAIYHVYARFGRGARVFANADEAKQFLAILKDVKRADGFTVLAWCLMPTHYHLAIRTGTVPLWRSLRLIQGRFALGYNRRHRQLGSVWQGRYKARLVIGQDSLTRLIAYIHLNPVKAGLVRSPGAWRLSGHRELEGRVSEPLVDGDETLALFGRSRRAGRASYLRVIHAVGREAWSLEAPGRLPWWRREHDDELVPDAARPRLDAQGVSVAPERRRVDVDELLACVSSELDIPEEQLTSRVRDRETVTVRQLCAVLGVIRHGVRVKDLAGRLNVFPDTVSRWVSRGMRRRTEDPGFARALASVERQLSGERRRP
jgi:REP element-mobilizing transposase RayT